MSISIEAHDRICQDLHQQIRSLIVENEKLRAALEQPEQEPVAWMVYTQDGKSVCVTDNPADFIEWRSFPLFTYPPRREWRGLTYQEIDDLQSGMQATFKDICAIEAALKEKNHE